MYALLIGLVLTAPGDPLPAQAARVDALLAAMPTRTITWRIWVVDHIELRSRTVPDQIYNPVELRSYWLANAQLLTTIAQQHIVRAQALEDAGIPYDPFGGPVPGVDSIDRMLRLAEHYLRNSQTVPPPPAVHPHFTP